MTLTRIQDRVYLADGSPATGFLAIVWPSYVGVDGDPIAAGERVVDFADGYLQVDLAPCMDPVVYEVAYHVAGGQCWQHEQWSVPLSAVSLRVHDVRVRPAA